MVCDEVAQVLLFVVVRADEFNLLPDERLVRQNVKSGGRDLAAGQRLDQSPRVDQIAAGGVDHDVSVLHLIKGALRQHLPCLGQRRHVEADDV